MSSNPVVRRDVIGCRDSERRLRALLDHALDTISMCTLDGELLEANARWQTVLGIAPEQLLGRRIGELAATAEARHALDDLTALIGSEPLPVVALRHVHTGATIHMELHARPTELDGRRVVLLVGRDITDRVRAVHGQKMEAIGALTGGIAHDFNNVLSVILTNSDFLLEEVAAGDPRRADVEGIRGAAERAASLTRQLLAFSRRQVLELRTIDLGELVAGLGKMLVRMIGEDIRLVIHRNDDLGAVRADAGQLEQIVMNLVVNARDAMPDGGSLEIATSNDTVSPVDSISEDVPPGRYVVLEVTDSGCGMDAETSSRVFEPFFTTKDPGRGTGLGLSTVYGIVRQFGGHVALHSELGKGTVFRVFLPRTDECIEPVPLEIAPSHGGTESVLLVEDDDRVRKAVQRILASRGYRVHAASNAVDAIAIASGTPIDLVLSDVVMPGMCGPDVVARIRKVAPDVRVLLMSGYTEHPQLHVGKIAGGPGFIQKPFTSASLTRRVRELLDAEVA